VTRATGRAWRASAALVTALVAVLTLISSLTPSIAARERRLSSFEPGSAQAVAHIAGVVGALSLLALCPGLLHGRRRAGVAAVGALCLLAAVHVAKGLDYEEALIALGVAALLRSGMWLARRSGGATRAALAALAAGTALAGIFAVCLTWALARARGAEGGRAIGLALASTWSVLEGDATVVTHGAAGDVLHVLLAVAVLAGALGVRALLAPVRAEDGHDEAEHARAAALVAAYGTDSLAPFVLRADKAFFFAHGGALAYRTIGATAVVSGDPVGPPGAAPRILRDFIAFAAVHGWDVVVMAAGDRYLAGYRALGLRTLQIGLEAVSDPARLSLEGGRHKSLRKAVNRIERRGWTVELRSGAQLDRAARAEIAGVQRLWMASRPRVSGFSMAMDRLWGAPEDARDVYVLGRAPDGTLHGFLRFLPYEGGLSLDAMRRIGDEPNGFTEALVVAGLRRARSLSCREVSLNFAGFAHVMAAGAILGAGGRVLRLILRAAHARFQLERLAQFNERFDPTWRPRHLVFASATRLPIGALRVLQAEAYVRPPRARPRRNAWRPAEAPIAGRAVAGVAP
jgi:lysyl-tRNA synthetase class 2